MFRDFSLGHAARHSAHLAADISPTSSPSPSPSPPDSSSSALSAGSASLSMLELQRSFDYQHLDSDRIFWRNSFDPVAQLPPTLHHSDSSHMQLHHEPGHQSSSRLLSVRAKRQMNARLHCNPAHVDKISALVEKMIARGEQCAVRDDSLESDSGEDSGIECEPRSISSSDVSSRKLKYRRSGELRQGGASVRKTIRQRRRKDARRKSDDK